MTARYGAIVTDVQGCFTVWKNGSLAVPGSDRAYVKSVEDATKRLKKEDFLIVATQDWHPPEHVSFASNHPGKNPFDTIEIGGRTQVLWPVHCVQGTEDAKLLIDESLVDAVVRKAQNPQFDSYSAVRDDSGAKTELEPILHEGGVASVVIYGIATDYCVKATAIDLAQAGLKVVVVEALCRGVTPETSAQALELMRAKGITIIKSFDMRAIRSLM